MPSVSDKQHRFMAAVAHSPEFAAKVGVKMSVGKHFMDKDRRSKRWGKQMRRNKMRKADEFLTIFKYNKNHDPKNGRFARGKGGSTAGSDVKMTRRDYSQYGKFRSEGEKAGFTFRDTTFTERGAKVKFTEALYGKVKMGGYRHDQGKGWLELEPSQVKAADNPGNAPKPNRVVNLSNGTKEFYGTKAKALEAFNATVKDLAASGYKKHPLSHGPIGGVSMAVYSDANTETTVSALHSGTSVEYRSESYMPIKRDYLNSPRRRTRKDETLVEKYNKNHDPDTGRFARGKGGLTSISNGGPSGGGGGRSKYTTSKTRSSKPSAGRKKPAYKESTAQMLGNHAYYELQNGNKARADMHIKDMKARGIDPQVYIDRARMNSERRQQYVDTFIQHVKDNPGQVTQADVMGAISDLLGGRRRR